MTRRENGKGKELEFSLPFSTPRQQPTQVTCAENISLLYLLGKTHNIPTKNSMPGSSSCDEKRTLPLAQERTLCGAFAFLASVNGNKENIPAVCIEEIPAKVSLNVAVAVNKTKSTDGKHSLGIISNGLEKILNILARYNDSNQNTTNLEGELFDAVISMCERRILHRLRLGGPKTNKKQPIQTLLEKAATYYKSRGNRGRIVTRFVDAANEVKKRFTSWQSHRVTAEVKAVVETVFLLSRIYGFQDLIRAIPNKQMEPSDKLSLCNMISKVSRYKKVSRHLHRTAKKYHVLRKAQVVVVDLGDEAFEKPSKPTDAPDLSETLVRRQFISDTKEGQNSIFHLLGRKNNALAKLQDKNDRNAQLRSNFRSQVSDSLEDAKVHAEVQLVYHYLRNSSDLPPRVYCSSKSACYLCDAFISLGKTYYTPRSHGRLYPAWRLPFIASHQDIAREFNEELAARVAHSYATLVSGGLKTYPDPNESDLSYMRWSFSTIPQPSAPTRALPEAKTTDSTDSLSPSTEEGIQNRTDDEEQEESSRSGAAASSVGTGLDDLHSGEAMSVSSEEAIDTNTANTRTLVSPRIPSLGYVRGQLDPGQKSLLFSGDRPEIRVENAADSTGALHFNIEWLIKSDADNIQTDASVRIVEADTIIEDVELSQPLGETNLIYISQANQLARLSFL